MTTSPSRGFQAELAMSVDDKSIAGPDITRPAPTATYSQQFMANRPSEDAKSSLALTQVPTQCQTPTEEYDPTSNHPFSAFYTHPTTRTSFEQSKYESNVRIQVHEADLEAGLSRKSLEPSAPRKKGCRFKNRNSPREKECFFNHDKTDRNPMSKLNKRQKLGVKIVIAVLIVGAAVGIGIGISKAVGGGVWKSVNEQRPIG